MLAARYANSGESGLSVGAEVIMGLFSAPKIPAPPPPPPPPAAPPTFASAAVEQAGAAQRATAAGAAGQGFAGTLLTSSQGVAAPNVAGKSLLGQ